MKNLFPRILLALIFALLQCVAPLVHAHIDGQHSGILPPSFSAQHHPDNSTGSIEEYESPAITLAHEFQRDHQCAIAQPAQTSIFNIPGLSEVKLLAVTAPAIFVLSPYHKSHPQAPPALG